jgi:ATP/maltotriose-dependent transcriptional regulator MalT
VADPVAELERGRESYADRAWANANEYLTAADESLPLGAEDLERLATAAYMIGRESEYLATLERAHHAHLDDDRPLAALRCAFWIGVTLAQKGEMGQAGGWLGRAQRILEREEGQQVEGGYLLLPVIFEHEARGDLEAAADAAAKAAEIGESFGDSDLFALASHELGHILIRKGQPGKGLRLLDEVMVAVTAGELSPIVAGIVYCGVILACQDAYEVRRAAEWTGALSSWCERQPDLVAFTGRCRVHRAEILQLHGSWLEALEEAVEAAERCLEGENPGAAGEAHYRQGEIRRLIGDTDAAEHAYREASRLGREPQPGLALLRLAQGNGGAAAAAIRRVVAEAAEQSRRLALLPACVEIMLATGDLDGGRSAGAELESIAERHESDAVGAMAAQARAMIALAEGDPRAALVSLRRAEQLWQQIKAPYETARVREFLARACGELGDDDTATLELDAARETFARLGAAADLARIDALAGAAASADLHGLTKRELEVLRHVASGESNKAIAAALVVSVRTVDRHVSNIFTKLGVSSRTAATAYAHKHGLVRE